MNNCGNCAWWGWPVDPRSGQLCKNDPPVCKFNPTCIYKHGSDYCSHWKQRVPVNIPNPAPKSGTDAKDPLDDVFFDKGFGK